jgi:hypothetical protein
MQVLAFGFKGGISKFGVVMTVVAAVAVVADGTGAASRVAVQVATQQVSGCETTFMDYVRRYSKL